MRIMKPPYDTETYRVVCFYTNPETGSFQHMGINEHSYEIVLDHPGFQSPVLIDYTVKENYRDRQDQFNFVDKLNVNNLIVEENFIEI